MHTPLRLVVLGGPGSGKGTQGLALAQRLGLPHLSTGEHFREEIKQQTPLGLEAARHINLGHLVPDSLATQLLLRLLEHHPMEQGFILDGYPRSLRQALDLDQHLHHHGCRLNAALYLKVSDAEILRRLGGRLLCRQCQKSFHREFNPPGPDNTCPDCPNLPPTGRRQPRNHPRTHPHLPPDGRPPHPTLPNPRPAPRNQCRRPPPPSPPNRRIHRPTPPQPQHLNSCTKG
ncbi:MAG: AAA family ATPase [Blastochloris sp.]|nr:AAA family ATPase [Blastochloris sp.]